MALVTGAELADALNLPWNAQSPDPVLVAVADAADDTVAALLVTGAYALEPPPVKQAALQVALEIYQARTSAGGQAVATDFTAGPYRLSTWLIRRVDSLLAGYKDPAGMVG